METSRGQTREKTKNNEGVAVYGTHKRIENIGCKDHHSDEKGMDQDKRCNKDITMRKGTNQTHWSKFFCFYYRSNNFHHTSLKILPVS